MPINFAIFIDRGPPYLLIMNIPFCCAHTTVTPTCDPIEEVLIHTDLKDISETSQALHAHHESKDSIAVGCGILTEKKVYQRVAALLRHFAG